MSTSLWLRFAQRRARVPIRRDRRSDRRILVARSWVGFGTAAELKRVSINGGSPVRLCELPSGNQYGFIGGTWSPDDERIVFSSGLRIYEVAARGGQPEL